MRFRQLLFTVSMLAMAACSGDIYVRDGVTDGDTFYLAQRALANDDPALQSWVSYSLTRSTCQLQIGGDNPARASSFECELTARRLMLLTWVEKKSLDQENTDQYLDELVRIRDAGYLDEYVARHFRKRHWNMPDDLEARGYKRWSRVHLPNHRPETQIVGSWNYARNVSSL